jgi:hypothetical protein
MKVAIALDVVVDEALLRGIMKIALATGGLIAVLIGLIWIGQGTGHFPYPPQSFMINEMPWAYGGAALAVAGLIIFALSRRM